MTPSILSNDETMEQTASASAAASSTSEILRQTLQETTHKVEASLRVNIERHVALTATTSSAAVAGSSSSASFGGLDFLDVKNSLLLSYLIDLTVYLRHTSLQRSRRRNQSDHREFPPSAVASLRHRLTVQRAALDKIRILDRKLRYQIDKLLQSHATSSSYAVGGGGGAAHPTIEDDPLEYRPDAEALLRDGNDDTSSSSDSGNDTDNDDGNRRDSGDMEESDQANSDGEDDDEDDDRDLAAARLTVTLSKNAQSAKKSREPPNDPTNDPTTTLYRAPRLAAVPYAHDAEDQQAKLDQRARRRLRAGELAATLRHHATGGGDNTAPDVDDVRGGAELGRQRESARRWAEREREKTQYEEDAMIRLTITRQEKKQQKRLMRQETSNLAAIADLGNLVRGMDAMTTTHHRQDSRKGLQPDMDLRDEGRYANGKRKRGLDAMKSSQSFKPNNALQAALFGPGKKGGGGGGGKKKRHQR